MNIGAAFGIVFLTVFAALALIAVIYPFRPFSGRKSALLTLFVVLVTGGFLAIQFGPESKDKPRRQNSEQSALSESTKTGAAIPMPCGTGGLVLNDEVAVSEDVELRQTPTIDSKKVKNEKASAALGKTLYHQVDSSTTVRRLCAQSDWTEVQIVTPEWLSDVKGWVLSKNIRIIEKQIGGARLYTQQDFHWDNDSRKHKKEIVAVINKIAKNNRNCTELDTSSMTLSPSKSKPNDPVFFVTCGSGASVFNVWFRPSDGNTNAAFTAREPLDRNSATDLCESAAKQAAQHPSTVSFSRLWDLAYQPHVSGRARVVSTFSAKNSFNLELKYRIDCLFDGPNLIERTIEEAVN